MATSAAEATGGRTGILCIARIRPSSLASGEPDVIKLDPEQGVSQASSAERAFPLSLPNIFIWV